MRISFWTAHAHLILDCACASHFGLRMRISFWTAHTHLILDCACASHFVLRMHIAFWSARASDNNIKLNPPKTKELRRACFSSQPVALSPIVIDGQEVDIVSHAKLLGVVISNDLKWNLNVNYISKKAAKRFFAIRLLKRSAIPSAILVSVHRICIRPVLEYACEVWHHSLPKYLSD